MANLCTVLRGHGNHPGDRGLLAIFLRIEPAAARLGAYRPDGAKHMVDGSGLGTNAVALLFGLSIGAALPSVSPGQPRADPAGPPACRLVYGDPKTVLDEADIIVVIESAGRRKKVRVGTTPGAAPQNSLPAIFLDEG